MLKYVLAGVALFVVLSGVIIYAIAVLLYPPLASNYHATQAKIAYEQGDYARAIEQYDQALSLNPRDPCQCNYYMRGFAYYETGTFDKAMDDFEQTVQRFPDNPYGYYGRSLVLYEAGDYAEAIDDLNQAIELDPELAMAHHTRGLAHSAAGNMEQATADFAQAAALNAQYAESGAEGVADQDINSYEAEVARNEAIIERSTAAIACNPNDATAYYNRAAAYEYISEYEQAIADYTRYIELNPDDPDGYYSRAYV